MNADIRAILRSFRVLNDMKSVILVALSLLLTVICYHVNFVADLPLVLIFVVIIFPLIFSISGAYWRRELALQKLAEFKANSLLVYFSVRDWLPGPGDKRSKETKKHIDGLCETVLSCLLYDTDNQRKRKVEVYNELSKFSKFISSLKGEGLEISEMTQIDNYVTSMIESFDRMSTIFECRTPSIIRGCGRFFTNAFPILYAPYFASKVDTFPLGMAYLLAIIFTFTLVSMSVIQQHLENPYDQIGVDDVRMNSQEFGIKFKEAGE